MNLMPIVCTNCGAKYRLPETFKSDQAKCKKCGAVIDVAAQRNAASEPEPAAAENKQSPGVRRAERPSRAGASRRPASSARRRSPGEEGEGRRSRHGQSEEPSKGKGMLIGVGIGAVAVVVVGLILLMGGGDGDAVTEETAEAQGIDPMVQPTDPQPAPEQATGQGEVEVQAGEEQPGAAAAVEASAGAAAAADAAATEKDSTGAVAKERDPEKPWLNYKIDSVEELFDPKTETEPVEWPDYVTEEQKAEVLSLIDDIEGGGLPSIRAKTRLEELDHMALAGLINRLREVDYTDSFDTMFAYELNKLLERLTITINANFQNAELGSAIDLRVAHWNAQTIKAWIRLFNQYRNKEDWDRLIASIKSRRNGG